jgi:hypothetical protein
VPWDCEFCGERFENNEALIKHLRRKHRDKVKLTILEHPMHACRLGFETLFPYLIILIALVLISTAFGIKVSFQI